MYINWVFDRIAVTGPHSEMSEAAKSRHFSIFISHKYRKVTDHPITVPCEAHINCMRLLAINRGGIKDHMVIYLQYPGYIVFGGVADDHNSKLSINKKDAP